MTNTTDAAEILLCMERSFRDEYVSRCDGRPKRPNEIELTGGLLRGA
jgi:hypothetical protein